MAMLSVSPIPSVIRSYNLTRYPHVLSLSLSSLKKFFHFFSFLLFGCRETPSISPLITQSKSQLKMRCRFIPGYRTSRFSSRASAGSNMGTTGTGFPSSVPVPVAHELLQSGHRYLDVRTPEEFSAGHVPGAINVPYMFKFGSGMTKNPKFLEDVSSQFGKDDEILVACQVGKRSLMAASDLLSAGYTGVTDIAGGYAAWMENGLPTES